MGKLQGADPGFPTGRGTKGGSANLSFGHIFQTLHENEEKWTGRMGGGGGVQNFTM